MCAPCLYEMFPHQVKRGRPGSIRPDHGPDQFDLVCTRCGATWVGEAWELCDWCIRSHEAMLDGQRILALMEPDYDPDENDKQLENRAFAWSQRLAIAIKAGLVTSREADQAVDAWAEKVNRWQQ